MGVFLLSFYIFSVFHACNYSLEIKWPQHFCGNDILFWCFDIKRVDQFLDVYANVHCLGFSANEVWHERMISKEGALFGFKIISLRSFRWLNSNCEIKKKEREGDRDKKVLYQGQQFAVKIKRSHRKKSSCAREVGDKDNAIIVVHGLVWKVFYA